MVKLIPSKEHSEMYGRYRGGRGGVRTPSRPPSSQARRRSRSSVGMLSVRTPLAAEPSGGDWDDIGLDDDEDANYEMALADVC